MKKLALPAAAFAALLLAAVVMDGTAAPAPRVLDWEDLVPPTPPPAPLGPGGVGPDGRPLPPVIPMYSSNPVKALDGQFVKLPGFIVPLESDAGGLIDEFLFVPYFGACIHVPPPPPNQLVYVRLKKPFNLEDMSAPFWVTGTMSVKRYSGEVADADYVMAGEVVEPYEE